MGKRGRELCGLGKSPDNSLMVACGDEVVVAAVHNSTAVDNAVAIDDVATADGVAAADGVVVRLWLMFSWSTTGLEHAKNHSLIWCQQW